MISQFLNSSLIQSVSYDKYRLAIYFTTGHTYLYYDVPYEVYESLVESESPGAYYNDWIKGKFSSKKIN